MVMEYHTVIVHYKYHLGPADGCVGIVLIHLLC